MSTTKVVVQWEDRFSTLWLFTKEDGAEELLGNPKYVNIPTEWLTKYKLAMSLLREVEKDIKNYKPEEVK